MGKGHAWENEEVESFNGKLADELLARDVSICWQGEGLE